MQSSALRTVFLAALAVLFAVTATAQSNFPPQVEIFGRQGDNTEGTQGNPFRGQGIDLSLNIQDPDPTFYLFSGWGETHSGDFCQTDPNLFQFFGSEGPNPTLVHPAAESGVALINVRVNVTEFPHQAVSALKTFFIAPGPTGCDGTPNPSPSAPRNVSLRLSADDVTLGSTIQLTARAQDLEPLTFLFFVDSSAFPLQRGRLITQRTVANCQASCEEAVAFKVADFPAIQFFSLAVTDGSEEVGTPVKQAVRVSVFGPTGFNPDPAPTPQVCGCPGNAPISVDAGPPNRTLIGGQALALKGTAAGPTIGGQVIPGAFQWTVLGDGGLGNGLQLSGSQQLNATLSTPDINFDTVVVLRLRAEFGTCSCSDNMVINVLANPPLETDLSITHTSPSGAFLSGDTISYNLQVRNLGPGTANEVFMTDLLPAGTTFLSANPSQGICALDGPGVVSCELGSMASGASASVAVDVRADLVGTPQNIAFTFTPSAVDPNINNDTNFRTDVVQLTNLDETSFFAQFGDGQGLLSSQIILFNPREDETANVRISLRQDNGQPLSVDLNGDIVNGELITSIPPSGLRVFETDGLGALRVGSATVFSDRRIEGVILFNGVVGVAGVGSSLQLDNGFLAPMESNDAGGINTGVAVMNPGAGALDVDLELLDSSGASITTGSLALAANGHAALNVNEFQWNAPPDFADFQGLMKVTSDDGPLAATVIQTRPGEFATLPVAGRLSQAAASALFKRFRVNGLANTNELFFAQFGDGAGFFSQIILVNLNEAEAAQATLQLRGDDGSALSMNLGGEAVEGQVQVEVPASGIRVLQTDGIANDVTVGSVSVDSTQPLEGVILFGGSVGVAGVGSSIPLDDGFAALIETNTASTINTGVAVMNLEDQQAVLDLLLRDADGTPIATGQISLAAGGHRALFVTEVEWTGDPDFSNFRGTLEVTSSGASIGATVIQTRPQQLATMPVASLSGGQ